MKYDGNSEYSIFEVKEEFYVKFGSGANGKSFNGGNLYHLRAICDLHDGNYVLFFSDFVTVCFEKYFRIFNCRLKESNFYELFREGGE